MKSKLRLFSILLIILAFPMAVWAGPDPIDPENFGDVELGSSSTAYITIQNGGFEPIAINSVTLDSIGADFAIISNPEGEVLAFGESADVVVTFTPDALGPAAATLAIDWMNGESGIEYVELTGVGVGVSGNPVTVQDILDFFDQSVADGSLVGNGPGNSANGRKKALRNKIKAAGDTLEDGGDACNELLGAYQRCDGLPRPPEFVAGPATQTLAGMILTLMGDLGCE